jgi:methyl-accepting chemotaxis protein
MPPLDLKHEEPLRVDFRIHLKERPQDYRFTATSARGHGFSPVANEVRPLGKRTKGATEEIRERHRIEEQTRSTLDKSAPRTTNPSHASSRCVKATPRVEMGMSQIRRARKSLENIIESAKQAEQKIQPIATTATRRTSASGEISESAGRLSQLSIENAQGAEGAVEAVRRLNFGLVYGSEFMVRCCFVAVGLW